MSSDPPVEAVTFIDREPSSGFMAVDRACLEASFSVRRIVYPGRITAGYILECVRAAFRTRAVYVFFASEHSLVPCILFRLLGRRVVLVQGGYDYANLPDHNYGLTARGRGWLPRLVGRLCTVSLAISDQSRWEFLALVPSAAPRTRLSHLALDPDQWTDPEVPRDDNQVVTFGYIDEEAYSRKGIDRFVAAAALDRSRRYVLAGEISPDIAERIRSIAPPNLVVLGHQRHDQLRGLLWSSGVYAQLSWHETFGVAMAEAMLCGCVPVIGQSAALAEIAGVWAVHAGDGHEPAHDTAAIGRAVDAGCAMDRAAIRSDVTRRFSPRQRGEALRAALSGEPTGTGR